MLHDASFPEDPTIPSLQYAVDTLQPIVLPWTKGRYVRVGTGFSSNAMQNGNPFVERFSFQDYPSRALHYHKDSGGTFAQSESSSGSHYQDHMQVSVAAKAEVSIVGASGQVRYEKSVMKNRDNVRTSLSNRMRTGFIEFGRIPQFNQDAIDSLMGLSADSDTFEDTYGDYYVACLRLGAANASDLSASSDVVSTMSDMAASLTVTVKIWRWKASKTVAKSEHSEDYNAVGHISYNGFDTLTESHFKAEGQNTNTYAQLLDIANMNLERTRRLQERLAEAEARVSVHDCRHIETAEQMQSIFDEGLVIELVLLPFRNLREYIELKNGAIPDRCT